MTATPTTIAASVASAARLVVVGGCCLAGVLALWVMPVFSRCGVAVIVAK